MKHLVSLLLTLSLLAALVSPLIEPVSPVLAQPEGSVVSDPMIDEPVIEEPEEPLPPTEEPVIEEPEEPLPPTDVPVIEEPEEQLPPTDVPQDVATEAPVLPAANSPTPIRVFQPGDLVRAKVRINCREAPGTDSAIDTVVDKGEQLVIVQSAQPLGGYDWVEIQHLTADTARCFMADQYLDLVQAGYGIPATAGPTDTATNTQTPSNTATATSTLTGSETATPYKNLVTGDLATSTTRVNCRESGSTAGAVVTVLAIGEQVYILESAQANGGYNWVKVQLTDAATTQCFLAAQYIDLTNAGQGVPPTITSTPSNTPSTSPTASNTPSDTATATITLTPSNTATATDTPTETATLTGSETATPYGGLVFGDTVKTATRVNCREAGTTSAAVVLVIPAGQSVYIISSGPYSDGYHWFAVQLDDEMTTQCFVAAEYVSPDGTGHSVPPTITLTPTITETPTATNTLTGSETATPTPTATETPTETMTPTETLTPTITLTPTETPIETDTPTPTNTSTPTYRDLHAGDLAKATTSINCRVSNSAQSDIKRILSTNNQVVVLTDPENANGYWWSKVRPLGTTVECYVVADYLGLVLAGGGFTPTPAASGSATAESAGAYKVGDIIEVTTSVNVRTDAGTNFPVVITVAAKTQGTVLSGFKQANGLDWIQVQFPKGSGWLAAKYTKAVQSEGSSVTSPFSAGTLLVVTSTVNLRVLPGTNNTSLGQLQVGDQGISLGGAKKIGSTTWVQVEFPAGSGWASSAYLKKLSAVTPTTAPKVGNIWVYLDCSSNPQQILVTNNNKASIRINSIASIYKGGTYSVGHTLGTKVTLNYQAGSKAGSGKVLSKSTILNSNVGSQEGVIVSTSLGNVEARCPNVTSGEKWIEVNLTTQTLYAYRGSTVISSSLVSTGKPGFSTPAGTFHIYYKTPLTDMSACLPGAPCYYTPNVPWDMLFKAGGFYIHGAYWHHDFGKVKSHGCVNLPVPYAEWLYGWTPMNTRVWIHY